MKKTVLTLALVAGTVAAMAQGRISIANDSTRLFEVGAGLTADSALLGPILNQAYPSGNTFVLALYAGTTSGSMTLQTSYALTGANYLSPGRGATKALTLTGVPGGVPQFFNIILTDNGATLPQTIDGAFYTRNSASSVNEAALASLTGAEYYGSSGLFQFTPSTSAIAAPLLTATGTTWAVGSVYVNAIVPEPSSMALAGLGAASLLLFRRRK
jgi:hypothetical protein